MEATVEGLGSFRLTMIAFKVQALGFRAYG